MLFAAPSTEIKRKMIQNDKNIMAIKYDVKTEENEMKETERVSSMSQRDIKTKIQRNRTCCGFLCWTSGGFNGSGLC